MNTTNLILALPHNLPVPLTSFIGREREIDKVKRLLAGTRLLTLAGVGGCGKTRLALQVAGEILEAHPDGVWLVDLAALSEPALVPQEVAAALGLPEAPGQTVSQALIDALRPRSTLLLFDNCEHLTGACAALVEALLRGCPRLRVLATSRERLDVPGETVWRVPTLAVPGPETSPDRLAQCESVQLFIERAGAVAPDFAIDDRSAAALAEICRRLDGIPLAIELAAARVRLLSVEEIAARLDDRFRLLTGGGRTAAPRHQTLRALIDWSYDLLSPVERRLFGQLAVFAGGWTLEAAEAVCADPDDGQPDVSERMAQLVDKSLVLIAERGAPTRYRFLETVRQYAQERLAETGDAERLSARHFDYYLWLAEQGEAKRGGLEEVAWLDRLGREHDNARAALAWALSPPRHLDSGLRLFGALAWFWSHRDHLAEGRGWAEKYLSQGAEGGANTREREDERAYAKALVGAGLVARNQFDFPAARAWLEMSLTRFRALNDRPGIAGSLTILGSMAMLVRAYMRAEALLSEAELLWRTLEMPARVAETLYWRAQGTYYRGELPEAQALYAECAATARAAGDLFTLSQALDGLGSVAILQGHPEIAGTWHQECLELSRQIGNRAFVVIALNKLGATLRKRGELPEALTHFRASLTLAREIGVRWGMIAAVRSIGGILVIRGDYRSAVRLFSGAGEVPWPGEPALRNVYDHDVQVARERLGEASFQTAWAEGGTRTIEQTVEEALGIELSWPATAGRVAASGPTPDAPLRRPTFPAGLSEREVEVLRRLAAGRTSKEIAAELVLSVRTVHRHISNLYLKIGARGRADAAVFALKHGLA